MIKQEIIEKICKYFKLTQFEAEKIYDDIFSGIINGVKEDNIADVTNLGEFIIKYNNGEGSKSKTVEFLPTLSLEEEINQRSFEEQRSFEPPPYVNPLEIAEEKPAIGTKAKEITDEAGDTKAADEIMQKKENNITEDNGENRIARQSEQSSLTGNLSVEDEIKRKREEILQKITTPAVEKEIKQEVPVEKSKTNITPVIPPVITPSVTEIFSSSQETEKDDFKTEKVENTDENTVQNTEIHDKDIVTKPDEQILNVQKDKHETVTENVKETAENSKSESVKEIPEVEEKSFSDYFTEISDSGKSAVESGGKSVKPPVENFIPPSAVELHNEITSEQKKPEEYQSTVNPQPYNGNGNGNGNGDKTEHRLSDNSYYIWYKDSEPNVSDTQTMSYEYELLYQATKEAEYKSKLRIYVTTFILFFSIVLILLIFSPVIYKYFFTPSETEQNTEEIQDESGINGNTQQESSNLNQASVNTLPENNTNSENISPPVNNNTESSVPPTTGEVEQPKQEAPKQEAPKQEAPKQEAPKQEAPVQQNTTSPPAGITKNSMGWMDDVNKVIYVQLENGKFTIQESAWDSDAKANKRLSVVAGIVPGLKGSVLKADLGTKGTWYRARLGEFSTIEEARIKAAELRNKEKMKLQALLLTVFLYA